MFTNRQFDFSNITHQQLNAKCLVQISKFARTLYQSNGVTLHLKDDNIIEQISHISNKTSNTELKTIYTQLQLEILDIICDSQLNESKQNSLTNSFSKNLFPNSKQ